MPGDFDPKDEATKQLFKDAINEWLTAQFALVGKWTLRGLFAAALAGLTYLALISAGWHK